MSDEEMNKKMEFIVEQQAQFAADIQVAREIQAQDAKLLRNLSDAVMMVVGLVGSLTEAQGRTDDRLNMLAQAQTRTEERLNVFLDVVERYISGTGGSESPA